MQGYTTNYVNLIADNLRDRYDNGFPILKELIQNADDAKARTFVFGRHDGFPVAAHPLLRGPGLWFFNDGEFKDSDARALRSFGINTKAGDATAIGKFGLGMKSVFHLCEALFYVASDGAKPHREGLSPWKQDEGNPHPEWEEIPEDDWQRLEALGQPLTTDGKPWFLLWVPLRRRGDLLKVDGEETGAIIERFPGDDPGELAFLEDESLAVELAQILPLLRHLEHIEHLGDVNPFALQLRAQQRLLGQVEQAAVAGEVLAGGLRLLRYAGRCRADGEQPGVFAALKAREEWPRSRYRDESGKEREAEDKTAAEGAVLFCAASAALTRSNLHWAVFLPLEQGGERLRVEGGSRAHALILHGQFFIDAGRKKIHGLDELHQVPVALDQGRLDDSALRQTWNRHLAQCVLLPLVIPALEHYVAEMALTETDCRALTGALADSRWLRAFRPWVCSMDAWVRALAPDAKPVWARVQDDARAVLRPLPSPPQSEPERPYKVFPRLAGLGLSAFDADAPSVTDRDYQWEEGELHDLLADVSGLFDDGPPMDYLAAFLDHAGCARPYLDTEALQLQLVRLYRQSLQTAGAEGRRQQAERSRRLIAFVAPKRRRALAADLPDALLRRLWEAEAPILLVPKGLDPTPTGSAVPPDETLRDWLRVLDRNLGEKGRDEDLKAILETVRGLLQTLDADNRGRFLRVHLDLRVIAVHDAHAGRQRALSFAQVQTIQEGGSLFKFAGLGEAGLGLTPRLARALPDASICLVQANLYRELFEGARDLPSADSPQACLAAIGKDDTGRLGSIQDRRDLLEKASDPGSNPDAVRGLRYLLHGSADHRSDDQGDLWIADPDPGPAWTKLWGQTCGAGAEWRLVPPALGGIMGSEAYRKAGVRTLRATDLIAELRRSGQGIRDAKAFGLKERDQILAEIDDESLWQRLPLHTTIAGEPVTALGERVYLATPDRTQIAALAGEATLIAPSTDPRVLARQRQWLKPLDDSALIQIALAAAEPSRHWSTILDALGRLPSELTPSLLKALRGTPWPPTAQAGAVKPEDVIHLSGGLRDQAQRLVAEHRAEHGACFAVPEDLAPELCGHAAWSRLRDAAFSAGEDGLERLALLLEDLSRYHIGPWRSAPKTEVLDRLACCPALSGWALLQQAVDAHITLETVWQRLGPGLRKPIEPEMVWETLQWLSADSDAWGERKAAFDVYLDQLAADPGFVAAHLADLRLAASNRQWRGPQELCFGADGLDPAWVLDGKQAGILGHLIHRAGRPTAGPKGTDGTVAGFDLAAQATPRIVTEFLQPWGGGQVPAPMIGVLLCLLGPVARDLAIRDLHPHSLDWLLQRLPWTTPAAGQWMAGQTLASAQGLIEAAVVIADGDRIEVPNLLGSPVRAPLEVEAKTLLAGALSWKGWYRVLITLRRVEPTRLEPKRLTDLLRATAERLYEALYNQKRPDLEALWQELDRSDQLEVAVARRLVLDHLPLYLRQLRLSAPTLSQRLTDCDRARGQVAEAETGGQDAEPARREVHKTLEAIARELDGDPDARMAVLVGVKAKLKDFEYDPSSIPFELFQNADDAVMELGRLEAYPLDGCDIPQGARRFVVEIGEGGLRFIHWGRPVNARGPAGFDGESLGYGRDLEKMLVLSASDKSPEQQVTGKFGLGFKSVLLACDRPRILSGRLAVEIVAGILPQPCAEAPALREVVASYADGHRLPGTLVDLPGLTVPPAAILDRFDSLAGMLCIFARAIRSIARCQASSSENPRRLDWDPQEPSPGIEYGRLRLIGDWGRETGALCLRTGHGALLIALGPQGFRPLPQTVPPFWVTAPLRETAGLGFAVNGPFDLDPGRASLARNSQRNPEIARQLGTAAGEVLGLLFDKSTTEWPSMREGLGLVADLAAHDFWHGLWSGLTQGWLRRSRDDMVALLGGTVAMALLQRLSEWPGAIPSGLPVPFQTLASRQDVGYQLAKELAVPEVVGVLGSWARFTRRYPPGALVSEGIGAILKRGDFARPANLGLAGLIGVLDPPRVAPTDAGVLGSILLLTEEHSGWKSDEVKKGLKRLQFRTQGDGWAEAGRLLANDGNLIDLEESLRHNVAPPEWRLHEEYYTEEDEEGPAMRFFLACRERLPARAVDVTGWVLAAKEGEEKQAALLYLAEGSLGDEVSRTVRGQGWLADVPNDEALLGALESDQRRELKRRLASDAQIDRGLQPEPGLPLEVAVPDVGLGEALRRIAGWWARKGTILASDYRGRLYPSEGIKLDIDPETGRFDRSAWLTLLALGAFQGMGRTREEQHRGFIELCQRKGWWQTFADLDPKAHPERWMEVIEEYAEGQHDDEQWTQWIAQFPKLYRLRRWMDDYVELFLSIGRFTEPFQLDDLRASRTSAYFQGGGIEAPPLTRTLRVGGPLVIRELLHHGVISNPLAVPHAYAPIQRIRDWFGGFGETVGTSKDIHDLLCRHLDEVGATFGGAYDIPLRLVAGDEGLQERLFRP